MTLSRIYQIAILIITLPLSLAAQSIAVANQRQGATTANGSVSLSMRSVPLKDALAEISRQSGMVIHMGDDVIAYKPRVSVNITSVTAQRAIESVLRNTGFGIQSSEMGGLLVAKIQGNQKIQGSIVGKVTDTKTGRGVSGANISLDNDTRTVLSDENGSYRVSGIAVGTRTVTVRLVGYAKQTRQVVVGEGAAVTVDFKLEPSANVLNDVVVTGTIIATELKAVPNAITVITAKQIEERGITRIDQLFRGEVPGLFSLERGSHAPLDEVIMYSRGATQISNTTSNTNPIKTYVDGIELADTRYLSQIDPSSIERIEILSGPQASTIYGANAINGVMQIFTKRGNTVSIRPVLSMTSGFAQNNFSSALASSHIADASVSGSEGRFSYNTGSSWNYAGAWSPGKQSQRISLYGGWRYQVGSLTVDLSVRQGRTQTKINGDPLQAQTALVENGRYLYNGGLGGNSGIIAPTKTMLNGRTLGLTLGYAPLSWWSHQVTVGSDVSNTESLGSASSFLRRSDTSYSNSRGVNLKESQSYSSTLRIPVLSLLQITLTSGVDHWRNRSSSLSWDINRSGAIGSPSATTNPIRKNMGVYIQGQLGVWDALFFTYGVRQDWNPNYGERARVRPGRYGVSFTRDFGTIAAKVRGSYGRSIRPPADGQIVGLLETDVTLNSIYGSPLYINLPSPELGPEFQQGGEGGIELYFSNRGSLVLTRYNQTVDGLISLISGVDSVQASQPGTFPPLCNASNLRSDGYCYQLQSQNLNIGSIRNQGWELQGSMNTGPFTTSGTYSWVKSRVIGVTPKYRSLLTNSAFTPGRPFNFVPEHTWFLNIRYSKGRTSMSANINGIGIGLRSNNTELDIVTDNGLRLRLVDAHRWDLPSGYRQSVAGYATANVNVTHQVSRNVEGMLNVNNLTNFYQNDFDVRYPTLGRQTRIGARIRM